MTPIGPSPTPEANVSLVRIVGAFAWVARALGLDNRYR